LRVKIPISQLETLNSQLPRHGVGVGIGKANVADDEEADDPGGTDAAGVGLAGVGVGVGLGSGGIIFSQWWSGTVAPPISFTKVSQRPCNFSRSGGPKGDSAVPGKIR